VTHLEKLIEAHTQQATLLTISGATERIAEEMASEILKDPEFREEMRHLIRASFRRALQSLSEPSSNDRT
jgi:predicted component of type VI protein secretion system